jgi:hypothetical protein
MLARTKAVAVRRRRERAAYSADSKLSPTVSFGMYSSPGCKGLERAGL